MIEIDRFFKPLIDIVNDGNKVEILDFSLHSKFSFSWIMTLIWYNQLYLKLKELLRNCFLVILSKKRLLNEKKLEENEVDTEVELISNYVQCIIDLSINEITVHHLGSTKIVMYYPYKELEQSILLQTQYSFA